MYAKINRMMNTLPSQARVMHEGVSQVRPPTHTAEPRSKGLREGGELRPAVVGAGFGPS
jgi:hypothetical protein